MRHFSGKYKCVLFREVRILGKNLLNTNMVSVASVAACDARVLWADNCICPYSNMAAEANSQKP